jgi:hypothetical protein
VFIMPGEDYRFTEEDLGALVAYAKSLPPAKGARRCWRCRCRSG